MCVIVDGSSSAKGFFSYKVEGRVNSDDEVSEGENRNGDDEGDDIRGVRGHIIQGSSSAEVYKTTSFCLALCPATMLAWSRALTMSLYRKFYVKRKRGNWFYSNAGS